MKDVDKYLEEYWDVTSEKFNEWDKRVGQSEYLFGMRVFFLANDGNYSDFKKRLNEIAGKSKSPFIYLAESKIAQVSKESDHAIKAIRKGLEESPDNKWFLLQLFLLQQDTQVLDRILAKHPTFYKAMVYKAYTFGTVENSSEIINLLSKIPKSLRTQDSEIFLAEAYYFAGKPDECANHYLAALEFGDVPDAFIGLATIETYDRKNFVKAESLLSKAKKLDPESVAVLISLGWLEFERGNIDKAGVYFNEALRSPKDLSSNEAEEILQYFLRRGDNPKSEIALKRMIGASVEQFKIDGYRLIIDFHDDIESERLRKLKLFHQKHGTEGYDWLVSVLESLGL